MDLFLIRMTFIYDLKSHKIKISSVTKILDEQRIKSEKAQHAWPEMCAKSDSWHCCFPVCVALKACHQSEKLSEILVSKKTGTENWRCSENFFQSKLNQNSKRDIHRYMQETMFVFLVSLVFPIS